MTDPGPHLFWITSRAAGITALTLSSLSVCLGLALAGRMAKGPGKGTDVKTLHESLALGTIAALGVHTFSLLGDHYLKPSVADLLIPFHTPYRTLWMSIGILSAYLLLALTGVAYARKHLGPRWKVAHRFTILAWGASVLHAIKTGTDTAQGWGLILVVVLAAPVVALLVARVARICAPGAANVLSRRASPQRAEHPGLTSP